MIDRDTVIALHESGHAVVARALGLHCGAAMMAEGRGHAAYEDEAEDGSIAVVIATMAGSAARAGSHWPHRRRSRRRSAAVTALADARGMTQDQLDRLWCTALVLARAHETPIRCVAVALQRRGRLSGAEIDQIAWPRR
jgi:hypothetical protein